MQSLVTAWPHSSQAVSCCWGISLKLPIAAIMGICGGVVLGFGDSQQMHELLTSIPALGRMAQRGSEWQGNGLRAR